MKRNTYRNRSIVFGCISVPFIIAFTATAANGKLTVNAVPGTVLTLTLIFFSVFFAVKHVRHIRANYADELRETKRSRNDRRKVIRYKMKFRCTRKMGVIWLDDKHRMFKIRFQSFPNVYLFSELVGYMAQKDTVGSGYTQFRNGIGHGTAGGGVNRFSLEIALTGGRKCRTAYNYRKNTHENFDRAAAALEHIHIYNVGTLGTGRLGA